MTREDAVLILTAAATVFNITGEKKGCKDLVEVARAIKNNSFDAPSSFDEIRASNWQNKDF